MAGRFNPRIIGIDFEMAFINMCHYHWPDADLMGCFFHFSQAMVRYLKDVLKFPDEVVYKIVDIVQLATVFPIEDLRDITGKGWAYIADKIDNITVNEDVDNWMRSEAGMTKRTEFFLYIKDFWTRENLLNIWNCDAAAAAAAAGEGDAPTFRTNCWSERYNRTTNEKFSSPHPTLASFITTLVAEMDDIVKTQETYRGGVGVHGPRADPPTYDPVDWPDLPDDYDDFEVEKDAWIMSLKFKKKKRKTTKKTA